MNSQTAREIAQELDRLGYISNTHLSQREPWRILDEIAALIVQRDVVRPSLQSVKEAIKGVDWSCDKSDPETMSTPNKDLGQYMKDVLVAVDDVFAARGANADNSTIAENTALREQLAEVRAENERLAAQLKEWQEEKDTKAGYL